MTPSKYVKVKDYDNLVKDTSTGAILNVDRSSLIKHQQRLDHMEKEKCRDKEINNIKGELTEIRQLLQQLIKKD